MIIFPTVDIEMFSLDDEKPGQGEYVVVVLKKEEPQKFFTFRGNTNPSPMSNAPFSIIRVCRTKIYKGERIVFFDATGYFKEQHKAEDIICWGRLKTK